MPHVLLWRIDQRSQAFGGENTKSSEMIRKNIAVTTAGVFSDEPLMCAIKALGEDSVMFSVDYPFEEMEKASAWFDQAPISESTHAKISRDNAVRLLKL